jgi:hypothetical protein
MVVETLTIVPARQIHGDRAHPIFGRYVLHGTRFECDATRVVDQCPRGPGRCLNLCEGVDDSILLREIRWECGCRMARVPQFAGDSLHARVININESDVPAFGGQAQGIGTAQPASSPGDRYNAWLRRFHSKRLDNDRPKVSGAAGLT